MSRDDYGYPGAGCQTQAGIAQRDSPLLPRARHYFRCDCWYYWFREELTRLLKTKGMDSPIIIGGVIPNKDEPKLLDTGVSKVFGPVSTPGEAAEFISNLVR